MIPVAVLASAIMAVWPTDQMSAERHARAIQRAAEDDLSIAAALIVTDVRESGLRVEVQTCAVPGIGGMGSFGLSSTYYGAAGCAVLSTQAIVASRILRRFTWEDPQWGFRSYIGARSARHREVRLRSAMFWRVRWSLELMACL